MTKTAGLKSEAVSDFIRDNNGLIWVITYNALCG